MNLKININFLEKYLAYLVNDFEYKRMTEKYKKIDVEYKRITENLKEYDLMADVDDQRFHHFRSTVNHDLS